MERTERPQLKTDVKNLDNEDRLEAIAGHKPVVTCCDLETISNAGKEKAALEGAEKATVERRA